MTIAMLVRKYLYKLTGVLTDLFLSGQKTITFFCYHSINTDSWEFSVDENVFKQQIDYLTAKFKFITASDLVQAIRLGKLPQENLAVLSFDDGYKDIICVKDFLKQKGIKPILFLLGDTENADTKNMDTHREFLSKEELAGLIKDGWEIGSHSNTHKTLTRLDPDSRTVEIKASKDNIESDLGIQVKYFSYPHGAYNAEVLSSVERAGYAAAFSMDDSLISAKTPLYHIPRVGIVRSHSFEEFKNSFKIMTVYLRKALRWY